MITIPKGNHLLLDIAQFKNNQFKDENDILELLATWAREEGASVITHYNYHFEPQGVSGFVVLGESHIAIHTWPEKEYASIDIYTCGHKELNDKIAMRIIKELQPQKIEKQSISRNIPT